MNILKKIGLFILGLFILLAIIYALGPRTNFQDFNNEPLIGTYDIPEIEKILETRNSNPKIKAYNQEEIVWADSKSKTEYAFVYLHGFSASHEEGAPIHRNLANRYQANLFLTRLPKHGLQDEEAFIDLTPGMLVNYAKEAIKIGKSIGEKVIVISCSTGSTLSAYLAAEDPDIFAQVMFSPNFELHDKTSKILLKPWGLQLARKIKSGNYHEWNAPQKARPYWYHKYRLEGVVALESLIDQTMSDELLSKIDQPLFVGYYYKDDHTRDFTVSTERIMDAENLISTPSDKKTFVQYPDGNAHVFISPLFNDNWHKVQSDVYEFLESKVKMSAKTRILVEQ